MKKLILLLFIFLTGCSFLPPQEVYVGTKENGSSVTKDDYPFNKENVRIEQVSFDILYGISKKLMEYKGEVPYPNTRKNDDVALGGFSKEPTIKTNPPITDTNYWGDTKVKFANNKAKGENKAVSKIELEKVNKESVKSLRLLAWEKNFNSGWFGLFYSLATGIVSIFMFIINMIIMLKSIDMRMIINVLNIDDISKVVMELFVLRRGVGGVLVPSPLLFLSLILLIITITKYGIEKIQGKKSISGKELIVYVFTGMILLGVGFNGDIGNVGNAASSIMDSFVNQAVLKSSDTGIYQLRVVNADPNEAYYKQQISNVNRIFIESQIVNQFGVNRISDLSLDNFTKSQATKNFLVPLDKVQFIENNLGYYYWYANSSVNQLGNITKLPEYSSNQEEKLTKMVTFMQMSLNEADVKNDIKTKSFITNAFLSFSGANNLAIIFNMGMLGAVFVILTIVLFMYGFKIVLGKLILIFALIGIPIASALIISGQKKAVNTGKMIIGLFAVSFFQVTVFDLFFSAIIYAVTAMLSANIINNVITGIMLFIMMKLNPIIHEYINSIVNGFKQSFSPELIRVEQNLKRYTSNTNRNVGEWARERKRVVGKDANGNPIYQQTWWARAISNASEQLANQLDTNAVNRKSIGKVNRTQKINQGKEQERINREVDKGTDAIERNRVVSLENALSIKYEQFISEQMQDRGDGLFEFKADLNERQLSWLEKQKDARSIIERVEKNREYQYLNEISKNGTLTVEQHDKLRKYNNILNKAKEDEKENNTKIKQTIENDTKREVLETNKETVGELKSLYENRIKNSQKPVDKITERDASEIVLNKKKIKALENKELTKDITLTKEENSQISEILTNELSNGKITKNDKDKKERNKKLLEQLDNVKTKYDKVVKEEEKVEIEIGMGEETQTNTQTKTKEETKPKEKPKVSQSNEKSKEESKENPKKKKRLFGGKPKEEKTQETKVETNVEINVEKKGDINKEIVDEVPKKIKIKIKP